ncbi:UbiA family prenyltransferase [Candidatus Micrarchaeota archaeon]|nr:UbiA family prenyltransferase [Candidatus Micrarchaeota archaeon]
MGAGQFLEIEVRVFDVLRIMMPNRAFASCVCFAAGMVISGFFDPLTVIFGSLMILSIYCSQAIFNNLLDIEGDKVNAPDRPLVNGSLTVEFARNLMIFLIVLGFVFAYLISPWMIFVSFLYIFYGIIYSSFTKAKWYLAYFTLATSHVVTPLVSGYLIFGQLDEKIIIIALFMYLTEMIVWSLKDYKDVEGDARTGVMTLPVVMNPKKAAGITFLALCLPLFLMWMPWQMLGLSTAFLIVYLIAGVMRYCLGKQLLENQSPAVAANILKNFRLVLLLQMIGWCLS